MRSVYPSIGLFLLLSLGLAAGCDVGRSGDATSEITQVRIGGAASGPAECRDFRLDEDEVRFFWDHAREIKPQEWHQSYDMLPCDLAGSFVRDGVRYLWQINAGGSGRLTQPDGDVRLYGCEACKGRY